MAISTIDSSVNFAFKVIDTDYETYIVKSTDKGLYLLMSTTNDEE